jgi:hypothetical protein
MPEWLNWLVNADRSMVAVTVALVQLVKLVVPSPPAEIPGGLPDRWQVIPQMKWFLPLAAFLIGICLSLLFSPHEGHTVIARVRAGIETGALAIAVWEIYKQWIQPIFAAGE